MTISAIVSSSAFHPPTNLQRTGPPQGTDFQQFTQALQSNLASAGQVPDGRDRVSGASENAAASIFRPAHHHRPHHYGGGAPVLTSGFPDLTGNSGGGTDKALSSINVLA